MDATFNYPADHKLRRTKRIMHTPIVKPILCYPIMTQKLVVIALLDTKALKQSGMLGVLICISLPSMLFLLRAIFIAALLSEPWEQVERFGGFGCMQFFSTCFAPPL